MDSLAGQAGSEVFIMVSNNLLSLGVLTNWKAFFLFSHRRTPSNHWVKRTVSAFITRPPQGHAHLETHVEALRKIKKHFSTFFVFFFLVLFCFCGPSCFKWWNGVLIIFRWMKITWRKAFSVDSRLMYQISLCYHPSPLTALSDSNWYTSSVHDLWVS